jgi:Flp pilus assembly protein TadG
MRNAERGATMVETSIVMLLALTVIFGIMDFGRALFAYHAVSNGARIGTRYAIVHGANCIPSGCTASQSTIQTYVRNSTPGLNLSNLTVTATWGGTALDTSQSCGTAANENPGCTVTVTVSYPFTFVFSSIGPTLTMSSTSKMVVSN